MTSNQQHRYNEILSAYEQNGFTQRFTIKITPVNGDNDFHVALEGKGSRIRNFHKKETVILMTDDLAKIKSHPLWEH